MSLFMRHRRVTARLITRASYPLLQSLIFYSLKFDLSWYCKGKLY